MDGTVIMEIVMDMDFMHIAQNVEQDGNFTGVIHI